MHLPNNCESVFYLRYEDKRHFSCYSCIDQVSISTAATDMFKMQKSFTYRAHKTGVMPGVAQGFKKFVTSFNGKFTAMAHGTKEGIVICTIQT